MSTGLQKVECRFDRWLFNDHSIRETGRSTSVFYRASGIRGYKHQSIKEQNGGIAIQVRHHGREERTKRAACRFLDDWMLQTFAKTLSRDRTGILAWYDHPISTAMNQKCHAARSRR